MSIAKVAVENTSISFDMLYSYKIPIELESKLKQGARVLVPFGNSSKKRRGFVFQIENNQDEKGLKKISELLDEEPVLSEELTQLAMWLSDRTFCTIYEAARLMLPVGLSMDIVTSYIAVPDRDTAEIQMLPDDEREVFAYLMDKSSFIKKDKLLSAMGLSRDNTVLERLESKGFIKSNSNAVRRVGDAAIKTAHMLLEPDELESVLPTLTPKQRSVANTLMDAGSATVKELCYFTGVTAAVVLSLEKKGILALSEEKFFRRPHGSKTDIPHKEDIALTEEQQAAFNAYNAIIKSGKADVGLLFGVTGSGKTKVYMRLIDEVLDSKRSVILMVPEISLTPQALSLFYSRYGNRVAVVHSGLSVGERLDEWKRIKSGEADMIIGTRSAVFAPVSKLGLIIIDEEQEHTYKSEKSPRYNAKDVAKSRCAYNNALLLLVSATPSIETYTAAINNRYKLCRLNKRYGSAVLPEVVTVDISQKHNLISNSISTQMLEALERNLENKKQALLLINRRGYNTFVACNSCNKVLTCPSCSISLTYHSANDRLLCHYCGYSTGFTDTCPECHASTVRYSGFGTQRVEDELKQLLPRARVLRMDADTTMHKFAHEKILKKFADGEYDILLGTQMIAKGLDFPNVTFVGVVSIDAGLYNDDYRSMERTFDLLTQVVGRSGRGSEKGTAMIQTISPESDIIMMAATQDYEQYYNMEINLRRAMTYPPFCDICSVMMVGKIENKVKMACVSFLNLLKDACEAQYNDLSLIVLGPTPPKVSKINDKYRFRLIIKCKNSKRFRQMLRSLIIEFKKQSEYKNITVIPDINPESLS